MFLVCYGFAAVAVTTTDLRNIVAVAAPSASPAASAQSSNSPQVPVVKPPLMLHFSDEVGWLLMAFCGGFVGMFCVQKFIDFPFFSVFFSFLIIF